VAAGSIALLLPQPATAQPAPAIPPSLVTPDKVETSIGTLEFKDGAPSVATAEKVRDALAFTAALNVFNNSFRGASAMRSAKGSTALTQRTTPSPSSPI